MVTSLASRTEAQQTDADFSAYCRATYNNSAYQRFAQFWGTEHACVQGDTRQGVDLAEACNLTTGNRIYEVSGTRVLCQGSPGDAPMAGANDLGEPDFSRYCRENFANSAYERRAESSGINHYCRRPGSTGGFTLQPVDLAEACQLSHATSQYRIAGSRVFCATQTAASGNAGASGASGGGNSSSGGGGGGGSGGSGAQGSGAPSTNGHEAPTEIANASDPVEPDISVACQALGGVWHGDTLALVDAIKADVSQKVSSCQGDENLCRNFSGGMTFQGYMQTLTIFQCHLAFFQFPAGKSNEDTNAAVKEACEIEPTLNELREQANSYGFMVPELHYQLLNRPDMDEICDCDPDIPDFAALVAELQQQAREDLVAEFSQ